jgi:site-specific recombinase XerD
LGIGAEPAAAGANQMQTTLNAAVESYLRAKKLPRGTRSEYRSTLRKCEQWGAGTPIESLQRKEIREFLDWVFERAVEQKGINPGRTANKAREHLRAVISWAWEQELIELPPQFPKPRDQRDIAGRHYLTKAEINALYFATHKMKRPHGWDDPIPVGRYWRFELVPVRNSRSPPYASILRRVSHRFGRGPSKRRTYFSAMQ